MPDYSDDPKARLAHALERGYRGLRFKQGQPLVDADLNEMQDLIIERQRLLLAELVGDGPLETGALKPTLASSRDEGGSLNWVIRVAQGRYLVGGFDVRADAETSVALTAPPDDLALMVTVQSRVQPYESLPQSRLGFAPTDRLRHELTFQLVPWDEARASATSQVARGVLARVVRSGDESPWHLADLRPRTSSGFFPRGRGTSVSQPTMQFTWSLVAPSFAGAAADSLRLHACRLQEINPGQVHAFFHWTAKVNFLTHSAVSAGVWSLRHSRWLTPISTVLPPPEPDKPHRHHLIGRLPDGETGLRLFEWYYDRDFRIIDANGNPVLSPRSVVRVGERTSSSPIQPAGGEERSILCSDAHFDTSTSCWYLRDGGDGPLLGRLVWEYVDDDINLEVLTHFEVGLDAWGHATHIVAAESTANHVRLFDPGNGTSSHFSLVAGGDGELRLSTSGTVVRASIAQHRAIRTLGLGAVYTQIKKGRLWLASRTGSGFEHVHLDDSGTFWTKPDEDEEDEIDDSTYAESSCPLSSGLILSGWWGPPVKGLHEIRLTVSDLGTRSAI